VSTVEVECRDATCPECGRKNSENTEVLMGPGETVHESWFDYHAPPVYETVTCYQAVCDHCGHRETEYDQWNAVAPRWALWECLPDWQHINGRDLCPECWWIDDNDEIQEVTA
jgi:hypothetical protein